ncbi:MAG: hypothetical protein KJI69_06555 [Patescibacteria group bacterium]|nr:hypothetical protein [Patescibacteria group bacterium]
MITVSILINGQPIATRSAKRIKDFKHVKTEKNKKVSLYRMDDGEEIIHAPSDGALKLAKKMLDRIKEI